MNKLFRVFSTVILSTILCLSFSGCSLFKDKKSGAEVYNTYANIANDNPGAFDTTGTEDTNENYLNVSIDFQSSEGAKIYTYVYGTADIRDSNGIILDAKDVKNNPYYIISSVYQVGLKNALSFFNKHKVFLKTQSDDIDTVKGGELNTIVKEFSDELSTFCQIKSSFLNYDSQFDLKGSIEGTYLKKIEDQYPKVIMKAFELENKFTEIYFDKFGTRDFSSVDLLQNDIPNFVNQVIPQLEQVAFAMDGGEYNCVIDKTVNHSENKRLNEVYKLANIFANISEGSYDFSNNAGWTAEKTAEVKKELAFCQYCISRLDLVTKKSDTKNTYKVKNTYYEVLNKIDYKTLSYADSLTEEQRVANKLNDVTTDQKTYLDFINNVLNDQFESSCASLEILLNAIPTV
jgi:hypothetical protein